MRASVCESVLSKYALVCVRTCVCVCMHVRACTCACVRVFLEERRSLKITEGIFWQPEQVRSHSVAGILR